MDQQLGHELLQGGLVALDQQGHLGADVQGGVQPLSQAALPGQGGARAPGQAVGQVQGQLQQLQPQVHHGCAGM